MKALSTVELGDYPLELRLCGIETTQFRRTRGKGRVCNSRLYGVRKERTSSTKAQLVKSKKRLLENHKM